jgi:mRNA interferase RelE/StbE
LAWRIEIADAALRQLGKLDRSTARRILDFLGQRLAPLADPRSVGQALRGEHLGEFWKYRVGDWRVICQIHDATVTILVVRAGNRREVNRDR